MKYLVYFVILFVIIVTVVGLLTTKGPSTFSYSDLLKEGSFPKLVVFFVVFAAVYPFLGFGKRKLYINGDFSKYREMVIDTMTNAGFELEAEDGEKVTFRQASKVRRFSRMFEDRVTFITTDNPVEVEGYRKDVDRLVRALDYKIRQEQADQESDNRQ